MRGALLLTLGRGLDAYAAFLSCLVLSCDDWLHSILLVVKLTGVAWTGPALHTQL